MISYIFNHWLKRPVIIIGPLAIFYLLLVFFLPAKTNAVAGSDFRPGKIIDDSIFFKADGLSTNEIQQFLSAKVPVCDTYGAKPYGSTTRAEYGTSRGYPPPYTCLKDYAMQTSDKSADSYCGALSAGYKTAAQIIAEVGQACSINQKVLIVLLQKEQSLITDDWPWSVQYRSATGYGCPDTAPCDSQYYGFFNQVYQAARAYKRYSANPTSYNYRAGRNNTILWHPNSACGSSTVYIENQATAGLYIYTPYRPNQAALNNLYGSGDACSSYGNRNFWRMFSEWFGSTLYQNGEIIVSGAIGISDTSPRVGQAVTIEYAVQNRASTPVDSGVLWICGDLNGKEFGGGSKRKILSPGEILVMSMNYTAMEPGVLKTRACGGLPGGPGWNPGYPYALYDDHRERWHWVGDNPIIIAGAINSSKTSPLVGETVTLAYAVKNTDSVPFDSGVLWICGSLGGKEFAGGVTRKILAPGEILTVSMQYTVQSVGIMRITACGNLPNGPGWVAGYPYGAYADHRERSYAIQAYALKISGAVYITDASPTKDEPLTLGYVVKNYGASNLDTGVLWVCGDLNGQEFGGGSKRKTLVPGEELVVSMPYTPLQAGTLTVRACGNPPNGPGWVPNYPLGEYFDHRQRSFSIAN